MITVSLLVMPGRGVQPVTLAQGSTLADLVASAGLADGRDYSVNGTMITPTKYGETLLTSGDEVAATKSVKGA